MLLKLFPTPFYLTSANPNLFLMIIFFSQTVVNQYYEAEVVSEYVIRGNTAVLKCNIPSFVSDFVKVEAWLGDEGSEYNYSLSLGTQLNFDVDSFPVFILLF
jgi:hypothetical protein